MDYEKKYKQSLALMGDCIPDEDGYVHVRPQDIFPELADNLDEMAEEYSSCTYLEEVLGEGDIEVLKARLKNTFKAGAQWQKEQMIDKACEWLQEHKNDYAFPIYQGEELTDESYVSDDIIKDLRKAMEE